MNVNLPSRIDRGLLAAQLADFADDADGAVGELLEVLRIDARGGFGGHCVNDLSFQLLNRRCCR
jgi:hypothetical protein